MNNPGKPTPAERQRAYRDSLRRRGYRKLDIWISPELWAKLYPHLGVHRDRFPGSSLVQWLENLELTET